METYRVRGLRPAQCIMTLQASGLLSNQTPETWANGLCFILAQASLNKDEKAKENLRTQFNDLPAPWGEKVREFLSGLLALKSQSADALHVRAKEYLVGQVGRGWAGPIVLLSNEPAARLEIETKSGEIKMIFSRLASNQEPEQKEPRVTGQVSVLLQVGIQDPSTLDLEIGIDHFPDFARKSFGLMSASLLFNSATDAERARTVRCSLCDPNRWVHLGWVTSKLSFLSSKF